MTLAGVGDGDGYPGSVPGRIAGTFGTMASVFSIALVIKVLDGQLRFQPKEASAYHMIH